MTTKQNKQKIQRAERDVISAAEAWARQARSVDSHDPKVATLVAKQIQMLDAMYLAVAALWDARRGASVGTATKRKT
jgi:hypothetical protein